MLADAFALVTAVVLDVAAEAMDVAATEVPDLVAVAEPVPEVVVSESSAALVLESFQYHNKNQERTTYAVALAPLSLAAAELLRQLRNKNLQSLSFRSRASTHEVSDPLWIVTASEYATTPVLSLIAKELIYRHRKSNE